MMMNYIYFVCWFAVSLTEAMKIGFLGGGRLAFALANGFISAGKFTYLLINLSHK